MKIEIEEPFKPEFKHGYVSINNEGRKIVQLYHSENKRKTISYARYRMSVILKRHLTKDEEVDHINNDPTDDRDENFQILTPAQNQLKQSEIQRKPLALIQCPECKGNFTMLNSKYLHAKRITKNGPFCSLRCSSRFNIRNGISPSIVETERLKRAKLKTIRLEKIREILSLKSKGLNDREISEVLNIGRRTVNHLKRNGVKLYADCL